MSAQVESSPPPPFHPPSVCARRSGCDQLLLLVWCKVHRRVVVVWCSTATLWPLSSWREVSWTWGPIWVGQGGNLAWEGWSPRRPQREGWTSAAQEARQRPLCTGAVGGRYRYCSLVDDQNKVRSLLSLSNMRLACIVSYGPKTGWIWFTIFLCWLGLAFINRWPMDSLESEANVRGRFAYSADMSSLIIFHCWSSFTVDRGALTAHWCHHWTDMWAIHFNFCSEKHWDTIITIITQVIVNLAPIQSVNRAVRPGTTLVAPSTYL